MARMLRNIRHVHVVAFLSIAALAAVSAFTPGNAVAQTQPRPPVKGKYKLKIDSSPQQAAVYWDSSPNQQPKLYGIAGYTPITIKVPKGAVKIVLELSGFKPFEQVLDVRKNTAISPTLERAPRMAKLNLQIVLLKDHLSLNHDHYRHHLHPSNATRCSDQPESQPGKLKLKQPC